MSGNRTGPAAADTASGDVQHVQPSGEQPDDTGKGAKTKRARDPFLAARDTWLTRCNATRNLPGKTFKVLYCIADVSSIRKLGYSWLSMRAIAERAAMSETAIRRALKEAVQMGFLHIVSGGDQRKPNQYWPIINGKPLASDVGELPAKSAVVATTPLPPKSAVGSNPRDVNTGKFTTAEIATPLPAKSEVDYRRKRQTSLLRESPVESPKRDAGRREDDDDADDDEIKRLRDEPEARRKAERIYVELGAWPVTRSDIRSVARGVVILEHRARMDFDKEIMPAVQAIARRGGCPRSGPGCKWMQSHVAAEVLLMRDDAEGAGQ